MINVRNLSYSYPGSSVPVLKDLNFSIQAGEIFGFLGPSGAGKTTTQKILNLFIVLPIFAFFVPKPFSHAFGIFPTHWPFQGLYQLVAGGAFWMNAATGFTVCILLLGYLLHRFMQNPLCIIFLN